MSRRITIRDVAEHAGVSAQTVSRVVNKHPDVAPDTLRRIEKIITELGYEPNVIARSLTRGRSFTLGIVAYGLNLYGPSRLLTCIDQRAHELGYTILLHLSHEPSTNDVGRVLRELVARQVDGIIWAIPEIGGNRAWAKEKLLNLSIPVVLIGSMTEPCTLPAVGTDKLAIGRLVANHLLAGGAQRVGIITGPPSWTDAQERFRGWRTALEAVGHVVEQKQIVAGDWTTDSGEQGLAQLLAQCPDVDSVFASNDQIALGALHAAHGMNLRIPQDVAIVGVDNIPEAAHFWPPLTSVRQNIKQVGTRAVDELHHLIEMSGQEQHPPDAANPRQYLIQPELVVRASSRPVEIFLAQK